MKNLKFLTLLAATGTIAATIPTLSMTSCSCNKSSDTDHMVEPTEQQKQPTIEAGITSYTYKFTFKEEVTADKLTVSIEDQVKGNEVNLVKYVSHTCSGKECSVTVNWIEETTTAASCLFTLVFKHSSGWTNRVKNCKYTFTPSTSTDWQKVVDDVNAKLTSTPCNTMKEALAATKSIHDIENTVIETAGWEFVWDQEANKFAIIDATGTLQVGSTGYTLNANKYKLWKLVTESTFNEYNQYSQYLKTSTSNALTKTTYSFISGFDCGENEDVKSVHYFYEKMDSQTAKDIIINTCSKNTNVDISAWDGNGSTGDTVTHYGQMCELTVVSNDTYVENGNAISATVYDGEIKIDADANITMTYVRDASVTLKDYKITGTIDEIYTDSSDSTIKTAIESQGYTVAAGHNVADTVYQTTKETEIAEEGGTIQHVFTVTGGEQDEYYETWSDIATAVNDNSKTFEGLTVTLNKDYDMSVESASWTMVGPADPGAANIFKGTIDGQKHSIINFNLTTTTADERAFFGAFNGTLKNIKFVNCSNHNTAAVDASAPIVCVYPTGTATFENVNLVNCHVSGYSTNGIFVSQFYNCTDAKMINCTIDETSSLESKYNGTTNYGYFTGGFAAQVLKTTKFTAKGCKNYATINGMHSVGGLFGSIGSSNNSSCIEAELIDCENYGKITINHTRNWGAYAAGFVGIWASYKTVASTLKFTNCKNCGSVDSLINLGHEATDGLGGFIGYSNTTSSTEATSKSQINFINCLNAGNIGLNESVYKNTGAAGFCGRELTQANVLVDFNNCNNTGKVNGTVVGHYIANLIDDYLANKTCTNCTHNTGTLTGTDITTITGEPA